MVNVRTVSEVFLLLTQGMKPVTQTLPLPLACLAVQPCTSTDAQRFIPQSVMYTTHHCRLHDLSPHQSIQSANVALGYRLLVKHTHLYVCSTAKQISIPPARKCLWCIGV